VPRSSPCTITSPARIDRAPPARTRESQREAALPVDAPGRTPPGSMASNASIRLSDSSPLYGTPVSPAARRAVTER
jgi:hypothetical protein